MLNERILEMLEATAKVLHLDTSLDAIRSKIQSVIAIEHRKENADKASSSYYDYPWVRDVFGGQESGNVICQKDGKMYMRAYSKSGDGFKVGESKEVQLAYILKTANKSESMTAYIDGRETTLREANGDVSEAGEVLELTEAGSGGATAKITIISAGKGSMGWYTEEALKQAAKDGIFNAGTQMFLNHQTREEFNARPEGDVTKLVGKLTGKAEYVEGTNGKPGRLVAPASVYPEFKPFVSARKEDIGLSVRVGVEPSTEIREGVPVVKKMLYARSVDYVTRAGRGGKIEEMYESFRQEANAKGGNQPQENEVTKEEMLAAFQEALKPVNDNIAALKADVAKHGAAIDRVQESNAKAGVERTVDAAVASSGLNQRGQSRVKTLVMSALPLNESGAVDMAKLPTVIEAAVNDEKTYLQESGIRVGAPVVSLFGKKAEKKTDEETEESMLAEADKSFSDSIGNLMGKETKSA